MIYIIQKSDGHYESYENDAVYQCTKKDAESEYKKFMIAEAIDKFNLVINPHWLNAMNYKDHNTHLLTEKIYKLKVQGWKKYLREISFEVYLVHVLKAKRLEFKNIYL